MGRRSWRRDSSEPLMRHGADVRAKAPDRSTAPHTAALFGNTDMVKFLIEAADVNGKLCLETRRFPRQRWMSQHNPSNEIMGMGERRAASMTAKR